MNYEKQDSVNYTQNLKFLELLADPVRAQIYFEAMLNLEITADDLMKRIKISRSTLTHHLTKLVEDEIFDVRIESTGRPIKHYFIKNKGKQKVLIEKKELEKDPIMILKRRIEILESAVVYFQVITSTVQRMTKKLIQDLEEMSREDNNKSKITAYEDTQQISFTFNLLNDEQVIHWNTKYSQFLREITNELQLENKEKNTNKKNLHLAFSGLIPLNNKKETI